ncbi:MAG TPA: deoxyribodipyrimidine photo-lyase [Flavobacteriaceae bacterium]|nr:deoxyribodipyrimidine photo-lyase [Flavobacteriaceae bacterium]
MNKDKISVFWFRRDLRLEDNVGLYHAMQSDYPVLPIFIFDTNILNDLDNKKDRRVDYIHQALSEIHTKLQELGSGLQTFHTKPLEAFKSLLNAYDVKEMYCNRDYEPYAIQRDKEILDFLKASDISFEAYKDQVIFDRDDILKKDGTPYIVYTPYAKQWRAKLQEKDYASVSPNFINLFSQEDGNISSLKAIGFEKTDMQLDIPELNASVIDFYDKTRDFPAKQGTTQLGIAFRFGTISIRKAVAFALQHNEIWLSELIWREFFMQILYHFPKVVQQSFREKYDHIKWRNNEKEFALWCQGKTGYPIVDAGMRQLNQTGYMHNRVRMIVASFLCKHLLIDWRWGEAYFAEKLNDFDLSANNGNWQWAAGSGCDAAPYFRVFNPYLQTKKFDENLEYIRKWVPELDTPSYPEPMVEHKFARERALQTYREGVKRE